MRFEFKKIFLFIFIFVFSFIYINYFFWLTGDEIWNYGFAYNISSGMIPYRDFNMIVTPLYSFLGSIFVIVFGDYLYSLNILIAILISFIMLMFIELIGHRSLIIFPFLLLVHVSSYNFLALFLLILIIYIVTKFCDNIFNDLLVGFFVSLLFLTKQTIGLASLIPYFYYSKNKIKSLIVVLIPILLFCIYLLYNNAFLDFINYCFLGMFDFSSGNMSFSLFSVFEILVIFYLIYKLLKNFRNIPKDLFYVLVFQIMAFPIMDLYHFMIAFIPFLYFILKEINSTKFLKVFYLIGFGIFYLLFIIFDYDGFKIYDNSTIFLYNRNVYNQTDHLIDEEEIFKSYEDKEVFLFIEESYLLKLFMDYDINKFDLINNGNMGYNGAEKYINEIEEICDNEECVFFVDIELINSEATQYNKEILEYVVLNYNLVDDSKYFNIYSNY